MSEPDTSLPRWRDPDFRSEVHDWVSARLGAVGLRVVGDSEEMHARPWSVVLRFPTSRGDVWFKANTRALAHEAALVDAMSRWVPDRVLHPLAVDSGRGWLLMPDGGRTLRQAQQGRTDLGHWERLLVEYAQLQRQMAPYADRLLALGVPDNRPSALPGVRADLLADDGALQIGRPSGLTPAQQARQLADSPSYAVLCSELDASGVAPSLQHDDLHDNNVFVPADPSRPYRVFDWGDATVAHPFGTLLVSLRVVADQGAFSPGAPELLRLRDAYLDAWSDEHDLGDLREACRLALRVGGVGRAACYRRALLEATPAGRAEWGDAVAGWLGELYEPTPVEPESPLRSADGSGG